MLHYVSLSFYVALADTNILAHRKITASTKTVPGVHEVFPYLTPLSTFLVSEFGQSHHSTTPVCRYPLLQHIKTG